MAIVYRPANFDDIPAVSQVNQAAINDLNRRHGFQEFTPSPPSPLYTFSLKEEPEGFWVAEDNGVIAGYSISWVRGSFWFLYDLFILPDYQGKGIGRSLIEKALEHGRQSKIANRGLITFAYNPASISLYIKYGIYPREPLYLMEAKRVVAREISSGFKPTVLEKVTPSDQNAERLGRIDELVLGMPRAKHHIYVLNAPGSSCHLFKDKGVVRGYVYVWSSGRVGPLAVISQPTFEKVMSSALSLAAAQDVEGIRVLLAGSNAQAISTALRFKMRISHPMLLMSAKPFGIWQSYLFHSPGLM